MLLIWLRVPSLVKNTWINNNLLSKCSVITDCFLRQNTNKMPMTLLLHCCLQLSKVYSGRTYSIWFETMPYKSGTLYSKCSENKPRTDNGGKPKATLWEVCSSYITISSLANSNRSKQLLNTNATHNSTNTILIASPGPSLTGIHVFCNRAKCCKNRWEL